MKDFAGIPNTTGTFPNVVAQAASGPYELDGTPLKADWVNALWAGFQGVLNSGGLTPDGNPSSSQFETAILNMIYNSRVGEIVAWGGPTTPAGSTRLLPLTGQGVLIASYTRLSTAVYVGNAQNATAPSFYKASDAAGTTRDTNGPYLILPDFRDRYPRGANADYVSGQYTTNSGTLAHTHSTPSVNLISNGYEYKTKVLLYDPGAGSANIAALDDGNDNPSLTTVTTIGTNTGTTGSTGSGSVVVPESITVTWCIRY